MRHPIRVIALAALFLTVMVAVMPADSADACTYPTHCVKAGETLFSIGRLYGVSPWTIAYQNGLANPNYIRAGQCLRIPSCGCTAKYQGGYRYVPGRCDTYQKPAYKPPAYALRYLVKPCDTLFSIGRLYGVSPWAIARANGLANPNYIRAGQSLVIPR